MLKDIKSSAEFRSLLRNRKDAAIVDFYADWCGPCKLMAPLFEKAAEKHDEILFLKINIEYNKVLAQENRILSIPSLLAFRNKKVINRHTGFLSEDGIENFIDSVNM